MSWYVLSVETGKENLVQTFIHKRFDESVISAVVPKRRLQEQRQGQACMVCRTMFPGYVFVNTKMNIQTYYELKGIPRCYRLLNRFNNHYLRTQRSGLTGNGGGAEDTAESFMFSKVDDDEMAPILQLIGSDDVIDFSTLYVENAKVTVCNGPLKGLEGLIKKIDKRKKRARIVLRFMGQDQTLDIGIEMLATSDNHCISSKNQSQSTRCCGALE